MNHLGGCFKPYDANLYVPDLWQYLIKTFGLRSALDIGCGYGAAVAYFSGRGLRASGVEGFIEALDGSCCRELIVPHDYTRGAYIPSESWDLGWCCEFVEHVDEQYAPNFLATFDKCRYVAMTHAIPGQGGYHHVNEKPASYWVEKMAARGFVFLPNVSNHLRSFRPKAPYGIPNMLFFVNDAP